MKIGAEAGCKGGAARRPGAAGGRRTTVGRTRAGELGVGVEVGSKGGPATAPLPR
jgi:hypothetical protein